MPDRARDLSIQLLLCSVGPRNAFTTPVKNIFDAKGIILAGLARPAGLHRVGAKSDERLFLQLIHEITYRSWCKPLFLRVIYVQYNM